MVKEAKQQEIPHGTVIAAIYAVNKAAKRQRDLGSGAWELLAKEDVNAFPPSDVREELDRRGLQWDIVLNDISFAPFAYAPAFRNGRKADPEKWPDARGVAINELEFMGREYDDDDAEYMKALAEQEALAEVAIDTAEATIGGLHEIFHAAKERKQYLYDLKADAIAKLQVPFVGFHHGENKHELYAFFAEMNYGFHMPVFFDEEAKCWEETGVGEVDEALWDLGDKMPDLLNDDIISMVSAEVNEEKSLGLSEEEAASIVEEFLAS